MSAGELHARDNRSRGAGYSWQVGRLEGGKADVPLLTRHRTLFRVGLGSPPTRLASPRLRLLISHHTYNN